MIRKFAELLGISKEQPMQKVETQTTILQKKAGTYKLECSIDDTIVDSKEIDTSPFVGYSAPVHLEDDPWFGSAPIRTEKQRDYMEQETAVKMQEDMQNTEVTCESEDIHQKIYNIATKNWTTVKQTQGGSENFQEGPGGWSSGTGIN